MKIIETLYIHNPQKFKIAVHIRVASIEDMEIARSWLDDNLGCYGERWGWIWTDVLLLQHVCFTDEEDAMAFKLALA